MTKIKTTTTPLANMAAKLDRFRVINITTCHRCWYFKIKTIQFLHRKLNSKISGLSVIQIFYSYGLKLSAQFFVRYDVVLLGLNITLPYINTGYDLLLCSLFI
jgi:hypothetical protein